MPRSRPRFSPPRVEASAALRWVLLRAFGPADAETPAAEGVFELASRLSLASRIGSRHRGPRLGAEAGAEAARDFENEFRAVVAASLRFGLVARDLATASEELGTPIAFLKGVGLELAGVLEPGARQAGDLDVLVPKEQAAAFQTALLARGYRAGAASAYEHQLPALVHPCGAMVEVHRMMLGVRLAARGHSAALEDLRAARLLNRLGDLPGQAFVPVPEVLAAHALVHGLVQHGYAPHAYPLLRVFADLVDLGLGVANGAARSRVETWLSRELHAGEVGAAARLAERLRAGDLRPLEADPRRDGEAALLHHALAGVLDERYGESLRFRMLTRPLTDRPGAAGAMGSLLGALAPGRGELEHLYGRPGGRWGLLGWRLWRPVDLLGRALRYGASAVASRSRRHR